MRRILVLASIILAGSAIRADWSGSTPGKPGGGAPGDPTSGYVLADGGSTMTGPLVTDKVVSRPGHDAVVQSPDGGVNIVTNGATLVVFRRDGVTQLKASATVLEPQGDLTTQTPDGGFVLEGKFVINKAAGGGTILEPKGNLSLLVPDGGLTVGPNKTTFQGVIKDETERCILPIYSAQAGTALGAGIQTWASTQMSGPITFTAIAGRWVAAGTGTGVWLVRDAAGESCSCAATCTTNGTFRAACVNGLGTGCVLAASANINLLWAMDQDGGIDACASSQPSLVNLCGLGKYQ